MSQPHGLKIKGRIQGTTRTKNHKSQGLWFLLFLKRINVVVNRLAVE
ncbi:hypothetical protein [Moraxella caviae]|nr:hypothetical protein [Moraxella caviae]